MVETAQSSIAWPYMMELTYRERRTNQRATLAQSTGMTHLALVHCQSDFHRVLFSTIRA